MQLRDASLGELTIDDDAVLANIALYRGLRRHMKDAHYRFRVAVPGTTVSWDRALFLNLTYWSATDGADVLCDDHLPADVLAHSALHHIVNQKLAPSAEGHAPSAAASFFGESIASAFDLYLVGRLLENAPGSDLIATQLPLMADSALQAGLSAEGFDLLIQGVQRGPEQAFEDMRVLLFDVAVALHACDGADDALAVFTRFSGHRFACLLHHLELSNWVLHARGHARPHAAQDDAVRGFDQALRAAPCSLDWLAEHWIPSGDAVGPVGA